jgi:hypothetical protein
MKKKNKKQKSEEWGNQITHKVFCERPDPHNDGETEVWEMRCEECRHKFWACAECVMDGDCVCPICQGDVAPTEEQAAKTEQDIARWGFERKFGTPKLN